MDGPRGSGPAPPGRGWRPSWGWLAGALCIVIAGGLWYRGTGAQADREERVVLASRASAQPPAAASAAAAVSSPASSIRTSAANGPAPAAKPRIPRTRDPDGDTTPDITDFINEGEVPTMAEVIDRLHQAGVHSGLGAFQPPGTRPPLVGLAVPEGFELPPGYVRHYQATDDGQRIEPILMFSPDHPPLDATGRPIAVPPDRVVPPELAPPGMPLRRIVIPAPADSAKP
jgi:hypothetical protein